MPYVNFSTVGDYVLLIGFFLKLLQVKKTELATFLRDFKRITENYRRSVNAEAAAIIIHPDLSARMAALEKFFST